MEKGDLAAAETEYRAVRAAMEAMLGRRHPQTFRAHSSLAHVMAERGKCADAVSELRTLLHLMIGSLGESERYSEVLIL